MNQIEFFCFNVMYVCMVLLLSFSMYFSSHFGILVHRLSLTVMGKPSVWLQMEKQQNARKSCVIHHICLTRYICQIS